MIKINIALELPAAIERRTIALSRELSKTGGAEIILDGTRVHPHITLVIGQVEESALQAVQDNVKTIASQTPCLQCRSIGAYAARGYVGFNLLKSSELLHLRKRCVDELHNFITQSDEEPYRPHITLLKNKNARVKAPLVTLPNFTCERITIFEAGKHGVCLRRIASFELVLQ